MNLTKNAASSDLVPSEFYLSQNYPNPFSEKTIIKFCVAYKTKVRLEVFNSDGKMIKRLLDEEKEAGTYEIEFSATGGMPAGRQGSASGRDACSPSERIYIYTLQAGDFLSTKKMLMIK
jgi:hypothetical protein